MFFALARIERNFCTTKGLALSCIRARSLLSTKMHGKNHFLCSPDLYAYAEGFSRQ